MHRTTTRTCGARAARVIRRAGRAGLGAVTIDIAASRVLTARSGTLPVALTITLPARMTAAARARAKINLATANAIRASDRPSAELARDVGLSVGMVNQIRRGAKWRAGSPMGALLGLAR